MKFLGNLYTIVESTWEERCIEICFARHIGPRNFQEGCYDLWILKGLDPLKHNRNHCCLVDKKQIKSLIKSLQKIHPFLYSLKEEKCKEGDAYHLHIKIQGSYVQRLFILTALRYTYEYPYNVLLYEAFKLTKIPKFRFINIISLTSLINRVIYGYSPWGTGHALSPAPKYASIGLMRKNLKTAERVHDVIPRYVGGKEKNNNKRITLEYWTDPKEFKKRVTVYKKYLYIFTKK